MTLMFKLVSKTHSSLFKRGELEKKTTIMIFKGTTLNWSAFIVDTLTQKGKTCSV